MILYLSGNLPVLGHFEQASVNSLASRVSTLQDLPLQVKFRNVLWELTAVRLDSGPATCMRVLAEHQKRPKILLFSEPTKHAHQCMLQRGLLTRRADRALTTRRCARVILLVDSEAEQSVRGD
jgi:hypothetical protein